MFLGEEERSHIEETNNVAPEAADLLSSVTPIAADRRSSLLSRFFERYGYRLVLENQPSDATLQLMIKAHERRTPEFIPLSKITSAVDSTVSAIEPMRISKTSPILIETNLMQFTRKSSDFAKSPESFTHAVRVLMLSYALVSCRDQEDNTWCSLEAAQAHISTVEHYSRLSSLHNHSLHNRIMEADMAVRQEWTRVLQHEPRLKLTDAIALVAQQRTVWPLGSEFRNSFTPSDNGWRKGQGKGSRCGEQWGVIFMLYFTFYLFG